MPCAKDPNAPWVAVWLSPQTTVMPGRVQPLFGANDVNDALADIRHRIVMDAEIFRILIKRCHLHAAVFGHRRGIGTVERCRHVMVRHGNGFFRCAHLVRHPQAFSVCGEVTSCTRWRSIYSRQGAVWPDGRRDRPRFCHRACERSWLAHPDIEGERCEAGRDALKTDQTCASRARVAPVKPPRQAVMVGNVEKPDHAGDIRLCRLAGKGRGWRCSERWPGSSGRFGTGRVRPRCRFRLWFGFWSRSELRAKRPRSISRSRHSRIIEADSAVQVFKFCLVAGLRRGSSFCMNLVSRLPSCSLPADNMPHRSVDV